MSDKYIISIDQSTQGTKALLFDSKGKMIHRTDMIHRQIIDKKGWISHSPAEIYRNTILVIRKVLFESGVDPKKVIGLGISNQRETSLVWNKITGKSMSDAIVWQCARATEICERKEVVSAAEVIRQKTGLKLSPYFPAAKIAWLLEHIKHAKKLAEEGEICHGTIDTYLVFQLTSGAVYATDYSNASRTQLYNIYEKKWDDQICGLFGISPINMPMVQDSNACFGYTDCEGIFETKIPIHAVMGDSHAALYGQNCRTKGMVKATYGTGSSIMLNIGEIPINSKNGLVTSLAWGIDGKVQYVLEGNLNYTGAVISWLKDDINLIESANETESLAMSALKDDSLYVVPAFSGLGAPYWKNHANAAIIGMNRTTKKAEIVRAALECIAYQVTDIMRAMEEDSGEKILELRVDGGPTKNRYLMQFQSDIAGCNVEISELEELSGIGVAVMAGLALSVWDEKVFNSIIRNHYSPSMTREFAQTKYNGWKHAVEVVINTK